MSDTFAKEICHNKIHSLWGSGSTFYFVFLVILFTALKAFLGVEFLLDRCQWL